MSEPSGEVLLTPGVRPIEGRIETAEAAASRAAELARRAANAGTFGVGGFLMDRSGRILAEAVNAVIRKGKISDPTAHVERQLIDWLFSTHGRHVQPQELVVVTSLDPCAMCAGAILSAGLNAVALAEDAMSGVHEHQCPHRMPEELRPRAEASMGFFDVIGRPGRADHISPVLAGKVPRKTLMAAEDSFKLSLDTTRAKFAGAHSKPRQTSRSKVDLSALTSIAGIGDTAFLPQTGTTLHSAQVTGSLDALLADAAAVIVDGDRNLLLGAKDRRSVSPARSSVLELVRAYAQLARLAPEHLGFSLPHPRHCSIVKQNAPHDAALALLEFGALGSFLEGPHLLADLPALGYIDSRDGAQAQRFLASLPPLYTSVIGITTGPVLA
jgi:cytosine deaminase